MPTTPRQGSIFVERDSAGLVLTDERGFAEGVTWTLSEDKNDRKWG
jgi:hypothetical protein